MKAELHQWVQTLHPYFLQAETQQSVSLTHMSQLFWKLHEKIAGLVFTSLTVINKLSFYLCMRWTVSNLLLVLDISWEGRNMSVTHPQPKFTAGHMYM
jgi:hypothetical protein